MKYVDASVESFAHARSWRDMLAVALIGGLVGAVSWVLLGLLDKYVLKPIACQMGSSVITCDDATYYASGIAVVVAGLIGLVLLVRQMAFRPLLVVLAAAISIWGIGALWLRDLSWLSAFAFSVVIGALFYMVFVWFSEVRKLWLAMICTILLVILFRLIIIA